MRTYLLPERSSHTPSATSHILPLPPPPSISLRFPIHPSFHPSDFTAHLHTVLKQRAPESNIRLNPFYHTSKKPCFVSQSIPLSVTHYKPIILVNTSSIDSTHSTRTQQTYSPSSQSILLWLNSLYKELANALLTRSIILLGLGPILCWINPLFIDSTHSTCTSPILHWLSPIREPVRYPAKKLLHMLY